MYNSLVSTFLTLSIRVFFCLRHSISEVSDNYLKPVMFGIHSKELTELYRMSTHVPGFQSFFLLFSNNFVLSKLANSSERGLGEHGGIRGGS